MNPILFNNPNYDKEYIKHITNHFEENIYIAVHHHKNTTFLQVRACQNTERHHIPTRYGYVNFVQLYRNLSPMQYLFYTQKDIMV